MEDEIRMACGRHAGVLTFLALFVTFGAWRTMRDVMNIVTCDKIRGTWGVSRVTRHASRVTYHASRVTVNIHH
jgi:hypothetical protein